MRRLSLLTILLAAIASAWSCSSAVDRSADSPTEAYKRLYAAVKSKDTAAIKANLTQRSIAFGRYAADLKKAPLDSSFENGMTGTTFSDTLPAIRDERVKGNMGAVEVWNQKDSKWEDLPFIRQEDGTWKLAMGESFSGDFKTPGIGRDMREREAANAARPPIVTTNSNNANSPSTNANRR